MANNFYSSQILPGTPAPKEKQHHLAVIFIIVTILLILTVVFWWNSSSVPVESVTPAPVDEQALVRQQVRNELGQVTSTEQDRAQALKQLKNNK